MDDGQLISIDWKSVGNDYLGFFPDTYPDLAFLKGDAWEALRDELATEMPESVFDPLSGFLARHGYELWNANDGSDMYHLAIVKAGKEADFTALIRAIVDDEGDPLDFEAERLGLEGARAALNAPRKKSRKQAQFDPLAETDYHNEYGGLDIGRNTHRIAEYEEDGQSYRGIANLSVFPFEIEDAQPIHTLLDQKHSFQALYTNGPIQYWTWQNQPEKGRNVPVIQQIIAIDDFASGQWRVVDGTAVGRDMFIYGEGCEDTLFAFLPVRDAQGAIVQGRQSLCRIRDAACTAIANLSGSIASLIPLNRDEVAVSFSGDKSYLLLIDTTNGQQRRLWAGGDDMDDPFVINDDEIGFFTLASHPHAELDCFHEHTAYLNRLNIRNGNLQRAELTGLYNEFSHDPTVLRDQPRNKIKVRSFEGFINARRGHKDWVVLTYNTTYPGKYDRAWFWSTATDEVVKITAKECPRLEPFLFHYLPARDRYVADSSCRLDLLKPFDELQANCQRGKLIWEAVTLP